MSSTQRRLVAVAVAVVCVTVGLAASGECHEVGWIVDEISAWGHALFGAERYAYARWWYGGPVCLDGGMVY